MSFTFQWASGTTWPIAFISCCSRWRDAGDSRRGRVWCSSFSGDHTDGAPKHVQSSSYFRFLCAVQPITLGGSWAASCDPPSLTAPLPWYLCGATFLEKQFFALIFPTLPLHPLWALPRWHSDKESARHSKRCKRHGFNPWIRKIPWSRK